MKRIGAIAALGLTIVLSAAPAFARDSYVIDQASMLGPATVSSLNERIASFNAQTGKEIVVQTVPSLNGVPVRDAAAKAFTDLAVNGVLIFIAKDDRKDFIVPDAAGARAGWFSPSILAPIYQAMGVQFKNEDYDAGVSGAVDSVLGLYRSHIGSLGATNNAAAPVRTQTASSYANAPSTGGFHLSMFWLIVLLVVAFLVIRSILRALSTPRTPIGYSGPPVAPGSAPYGAQGYGPGYGGMGGGGSFFSGLLGGLGGAFLGNELFGGNRGGGSLGGGDQGGSWSGNGGGAAPDAGGWSSDAGQGDAGAGGGGGDWSGGGFGDSGGGGDFGGGGGGDSGGGW